MGWPSKDPANYYDQARGGLLSLPWWRGSDWVVWTPASIALRVGAAGLWIAAFTQGWAAAFAGAVVAFVAATVLERFAKRRAPGEGSWLIRGFWTRRERYHALPTWERWAVVLLGTLAGVIAGVSIGEESWGLAVTFGVLCVAGIVYLEWRRRGLRAADEPPSLPHP